MFDTQRNSRNLVALLLVASFAVSQVLVAESLSDAWRAAESASSILASSDSRAQAAEQRFKAAKDARLPSLSIDAAYLAMERAPEIVVGLSSLSSSFVVPAGDDSLYAYAAVVQLPLFTSGLIHQGVAAKAALMSAAQQTRLTKGADLRLQVARTYLDVLRVQSAEEVAQSLVHSLEAHAADVNNLFAEGLVARNDLLASQVVLSEAEQRLIEANNTLDLAKSAYNRLLGRPLSSSVWLEPLEPFPVASDLDALTARSALERTELRTLEFEEEALRRQAGAARAETLPQIGFLGGHTFVESDLLVDEGLWSAGVVLRWAPFQGNRKRREARAASHEADAVAAVSRDVETQFALQVRSAWLAVDEASRRLEVAGTAVLRAEENLEVARDRYAQGLGTNTEVLDAETLLTSSRRSLDDAHYDEVAATIALRYATGDL